jgi:hypothetical protein
VAGAGGRVCSKIDRGFSTIEDGKYRTDRVVSRIDGALRLVGVALRQIDLARSAIDRGVCPSGRVGCGSDDAFHKTDSVVLTIDVKEGQVGRDRCKSDGDAYTSARHVYATGEVVRPIDHVADPIDDASGPTGAPVR